MFRTILNRVYRYDIQYIIKSSEGDRRVDLPATVYENDKLFALVHDRDDVQEKRSDAVKSLDESVKLVCEKDESRFMEFLGETRDVKVNIGDLDSILSGLDSIEDHAGYLIKIFVKVHDCQKEIEMFEERKSRVAGEEKIEKERQSLAIEEAHRFPKYQIGRLTELFSIPVALAGTVIVGAWTGAAVVSMMPVTIFDYFTPPERRNHRDTSADWLLLFMGPFALPAFICSRIEDRMRPRDTAPPSDVRSY